MPWATQLRIHLLRVGPKGGSLRLCIRMRGAGNPIIAFATLAGTLSGGRSTAIATRFVLIASTSTGRTFCAIRHKRKCTPCAGPVASPVSTNHSVEWRVGGQGLDQSADRGWPCGARDRWPCGQSKQNTMWEQSRQ